MALVTGIHHITAMSSGAQENIDFYTGVLGLRLVKKTVNFDAPDVYHFYYGDWTGSPGSILTFFPFRHMKRGNQGTGQTASIRFQVPPGSLPDWKTFLDEKDVPWSDAPPVFGDPRIVLKDPDGMRLELVEAAGPKSAGAGRAILTVHSAVLALGDFRPTERVLTGSMDFASVGAEGHLRRYQAQDGSIVDLETDPQTPRGVPGAGTVHHIAFRTPNASSQVDLRQLLQDTGFRSISPVLDRQYFTSIYYREPGGVLFEAATDPPGFAVDEDLASLGTSLKLPEWLEESRSEIEAALEPIHVAQGGKP